MKPRSISVRLQRTIHQSVHVSVPVTDEVMSQQSDGVTRLDPEKVFARATEIGSAEQHMWIVEDDHIEVHPFQTPPR
ncbi:MAG TPA: hypothetical protein VHN14_13800 [Kofleriaceae bacterium]|nr:hypothetical protein [Kofleriaceae bacterium]